MNRALGMFGRLQLALGVVDLVIDLMLIARIDRANAPTLEPDPAPRVAEVVAVLALHRR